MKVTEAHLEARRDDILNAALRVFARQGLDGAAMPEIAEAAGISVGAIYRYFPGKEELFQACCTRAREESADLIRQSLEQGAGDERPLAWIEYAGDAIFAEGSTACGDPALMLEVAMYSLRDEADWGPEFRRAQVATFERLRAAIDEERAAGTIDPTFDAITVATLLYALVPGMRLTSLEVAGSASGPEVVSLVTELLRRTGPKGGRAREAGMGGK